MTFVVDCAGGSIESVLPASALAIRRLVVLNQHQPFYPI